MSFIKDILANAEKQVIEFIEKNGAELEAEALEKGAALAQKISDKLAAGAEEIKNGGKIVLEEKEAINSAEPSENPDAGKVA